MRQQTTLEARASDGTLIQVETHGDRSNPAIFLASHFYPSRTRDDDSFTDVWIDRLEQDFFLILADYPRGIGRTRNPQGLAYDAETAALEYSCIAAAAGVERFGWLGYSFGGAMGVQIACRTNYIAALAVGGFPPLNAPFRRLFEIAKAMTDDPPQLPESIDPDVLGSTVGFYSSLILWPERCEIGKLNMPRLAFMGDRDGVEPDPQAAPLAQHLRSAEGELIALGWDVAWLPGEDHITSIRPEVSCDIVRRFFRDALIRK